MTVANAIGLRLDTTYNTVQLLCVLVHFEIDTSYTYGLECYNFKVNVLCTLRSSTLGFIENSEQLSF